LSSLESLPYYNFKYVKLSEIERENDDNDEFNIRDDDNEVTSGQNQTAICVEVGRVSPSFNDRKYFQDVRVAENMHFDTAPVKEKSLKMLNAFKKLGTNYNPNTSMLD